MTRYEKEDGMYVIRGKKYELLEGSRAQVMHGTAYKTSGELKKDDLMKNKEGRIVSKKKHMTAKKEKRLVKAGYLTRKGHFGFVRSKKMHLGGSGVKPLVPLSLGEEVDTFPYASVGGKKSRKHSKKARSHRRK